MRPPQMHLIAPHPPLRGQAVMVFTAMLLGSAILALVVGSVSISPVETLYRCHHAVQGQSEWDATDRILFEARLPRILLAGCTGAGLALAGLAAQTLFLNPLASPYVIGVSSGSALGAVIAILTTGAMGWGFGIVPAASVIFGIAITGILFMMARGGRHLAPTLLLAGIAIGSFCAALTAGALYLAEERLQTLVFWMMGGFWRATWRDVGLMLPMTMVAWAVVWRFSLSMDVLLLGRRSAGDMGVHVPRTIQILLILIGATTAVAVSLCGIIGFVDLIVPHLLRRIVGGRHRELAPACALTGGTIMILADLLARTVASPAEVPVGIVTAILGSPIFFWLLLRRSPAEVRP